MPVAAHTEVHVGDVGVVSGGLSASITSHAQAVAVHACGEIDSVNVEAWADLVAGAASRAACRGDRATLVIDLERVSFMSVRALCVLGDAAATFGAAPTVIADGAIARHLQLVFEAEVMTVVSPADCIFGDRRLPARINAQSPDCSLAEPA